MGGDLPHHYPPTLRVAAIMMADVGKGVGILLAVTSNIEIT